GGAAARDGGGDGDSALSTPTIASRRSDCLIGFVRYVETPSSRQRARSPGRPPEVSIMMDAPTSRGWRLMCPARAKPSMSGMFASSRTSGKGRPARWAFSMRAVGGGPAGRGHRPQPPVAEHLDEDASVGGVVVHDEDAQAAELRGLGLGARRRQREGEREAEAAAPAGLAVERDPS